MRTSRAAASPDPRRTALEALLGNRGGANGLSSRDAAFALRLQRETTIWRARLDNALARFLSKPLRSLDERTLAVLRLGAVQLLVLETPVHAAVSETVGLAANPGARGLVNAVLRRLASEGEEPGLPLHIRWSHPPGLVRRWLDRFGTERTEALLSWNNEPPTLGGFAFGAPPPGAPGQFLEAYRVFDRGVPLPPPDVFVQDEAAAIAARVFAALPGGTALELGAAPGGKTAHQQGSFTVSLDRSPGRMTKWLENRERLGWTHAHPVVADGVIPPFKGRFRKVFVDAPCSNTGVLRRRPGARWRWSSESLAGLSEIQASLLSSAADLVEPGGILFYSTCSLEFEENEMQAERFLKGHNGFEHLSLDVPDLLAKDGMMVSFPPESRVDGIFAAAFRHRCAQP